MGAYKGMAKDKWVNNEPNSPCPECGQEEGTMFLEVFGRCYACCLKAGDW